MSICAIAGSKRQQCALTIVDQSFPRQKAVELYSPPSLPENTCSFHGLPNLVRSSGGCCFAILFQFPLSRFFLVSRYVYHCRAASESTVCECDRCVVLARGRTLNLDIKREPTPAKVFFSPGRARLLVLRVSWTQQSYTEYFINVRSLRE